jgi:lysozyme
VDLFDQLRRDEGLRLRPYTDTVGKLTIGYGRNLLDVGISIEEAEIFLGNDVRKALDILHSRLPWYQALDPVRQAVLVNMIFNMGFTKLEGFENFLRATAKGNWKAAATEMLDSLWSKQVGDRANRLARQISSGQWT